MTPVATTTLAHVLTRLREVQTRLGFERVAGDDPESRLADLLDSMGLVELLAVLARDHSLHAEAIEKAAGHRFTTVAALAAVLEQMSATNILHNKEVLSTSYLVLRTPYAALTAVRTYLPQQVEDAATLDARLGRSSGWLSSHAGIHARHVWGDEDPLRAAADTARAVLDSAGLLVEEVGALLVTAQAPPLLAGLGAALHQRIGLMPRAVALEIGGACTGFLHALWLARALVERVETALIVCIEAPTFHLHVEPGEAGEAAALFGDGVACCLVSRLPLDATSLVLLDVELGVQPEEGLLRVEGSGLQGIRLRMDGPRLATRAVETLAGLVEQTAERHQLKLAEVSGVIVHGGNGRLPGLVARRLGLPEEKVWSETANTGNLGSASLPMAWAARADRIAGPVFWAAIGAGLTTGVAITHASHPFE